MISIGDRVRFLCVAAVAAGLSLSPVYADSIAPAKKSSPKSSTPAAAKASGKPTIMDFGAAWCVPCKEFAPIFAKVKTQYGTKAEFISIDAETPDGEKQALKYNVASFPTLVITDAKGKVLFKKNGKMDEKSFVAEVTKVVGK